MENEFLRVLYDMDYNFTNHTFIFEKMAFIFEKVNSVILDFLYVYWFQTMTSLSIIFILLHLNHLQNRLTFLENFFEKHLENSVEDSLEFDKLKKNVKKLKKKLKKLNVEEEEQKYCKAIANLHFEKRRGLIQCENLAEEGSDFCNIHDERDILPSSEEDDSHDSHDLHNDPDYVYESADEED